MNLIEQYKNDSSTSISQKSGVVLVVKTAIIDYDNGHVIVSDNTNDQTLTANNSEYGSICVAKPESMTNYNGCTTWSETCMEEVINTGVIQSSDLLSPDCYFIILQSSTTDKKEVLSFLSNFLSTRGFEIYIDQENDKLYINCI